MSWTHWERGGRQVEAYLVPGRGGRLEWWEHRGVWGALLPSRFTLLLSSPLLGESRPLTLVLEVGEQITVPAESTSASYVTLEVQCFHSFLANNHFSKIKCPVVPYAAKT